MKDREIKDVDVGQKIYVSQRDMFSTRYENLNEYEVTKINTNSIYAKEMGSEREIRFTKSSLEHTNGCGVRYQAYLSPDTYWNKIEEEKEINKMKKRIKEIVLTLDYEELKEMESIVNKYKNL